MYKAALDAFAQEGFDRASMDKIAKQLNTGGGALYRYVENKEKLFHFVAEVLLYKQARDLNESLSSGLKGGGEENIISRIYIAASRALIERTPMEYKFSLKALFEFGGVETKKEFYRRYYETLSAPIAEALKRGVESGELSANIDLTLASAMILETISRLDGVNGFSYLAFRLPEGENKEKRIDGLVKLFYEGLRPR
ncbi:MAG: hypothetical protein Kow0090_20370 [Myxococcota bacterium]